MQLKLYKTQNGNALDLIANKYVSYQGLKRQRSDVDAPNSGRALSGLMIRSRVATKYRWDVTCNPLPTAEIQKILEYIQPQKFWVTLDDPLLGTRTKIAMYSNNFSVDHVITKLDTSTTPATKVDYWKLTFPLIEY